MNLRTMNAEELETIVPGEAFTLTAVMAVLAIAITAVIVYKIFKTSTGSAKIPGGWQFTWK